MQLILKAFFILRTFGVKYFLIRFSQVCRARLDDIRRNRHHRRIVREIGAGSHEIICLGKKFLIDTDDRGLHRDLLCDRIREPVATSILLHRVGKGDVFIDVGANIGYYSILLAEYCAVVHAIEPCEKNFTRLCRNIELNGIHNIICHSFAASDDEKPLVLEHSQKSNWHQTRKPSQNDSSELIDAMSVDAFCAKHDVSPTVMKLDVEGFEKYVFAGCKRTLANLRYLFFELHGTALELFEIRNILETIAKSGLKIETVIRYDRPGLWIEVGPSAIDRILKGDYAIYELIYSRPS